MGQRGLTLTGLAGQIILANHVALDFYLFFLCAYLQQIMTLFTILSDMSLSSKAFIAQFMVLNMAWRCRCIVSVLFDLAKTKEQERKSDFQLGNMTDVMSLLIGFKTGFLIKWLSSWDCVSVSAVSIRGKNHLPYMLASYQHDVALPDGGSN
jgi:hypothetical protein